jgi:menaquinone-dependent protoporphyrinogen oxidase
MIYVRVYAGIGVLFWSVKCNIMNILIVYGSTEGHTKKIADFLKNEALNSNHHATVVPASDKCIAPHDFDTVIIASSIHAGQYSNEIMDYVVNHVEVLNFLPSAFLSVGLSITRKDPEVLKQLEETTQRFLHITKWAPLVTEQVAGALLYTQYGFFKKMLVRSIMKKAGGDTDTSRDFEYTDWESLRSFLKAFIRESEVIGIT